MPDLTFQVEGAEAIPFAAAPLIAFQLKVQNAIPDEEIHTVALRAQIQIDATRRRYTPEEKGKLQDLFGEPDRWSRTLRTMLWIHASTVITSFQGSAKAELQVPCTFDFNVAATKYFHGITEGDIPLSFLFSGTVFYAAQGNLRVTPIPWDREAKFKLPVQVWRDMMDLYYPNSAWLSLRKDVFERLYQYKMSKGIPTFEEALGGLLS
jgi:hypothetical protein